MRLLQLEDDDGFSLVEFFGQDIPPYAILSHTWGPASEEVSFRDLTEDTGKNKPGYRKLMYCRQQAARDNLQYFWVDTCCIDKTSSAELSEAINSMWRWYKNSTVCYAYLVDVPGTTDIEYDDTTFIRSKWFTRGWTLQELLAPKKVVLFNTAWGIIGTKDRLARKISLTTGIDTRYLDSKTLTLERASVAERMSWASTRKTTREEDIAYCLLGIFDISMPLLYGEGSKAFRRLQEEIMKHSDDQSLFSWGFDTSWNPNANWNRPDYLMSSLHDYDSRESGSLLAESPVAFRRCGNIVRSANTSSDKPYSITNRGLQIEFPVLQVNGETFARLNCRFVDDIFNDLAIHILKNRSNDQYRRHYWFRATVPVTEWRRARLRSMYFSLTSIPEESGPKSDLKENSCLIRNLPPYYSILRVFPPDAYSSGTKQINLQARSPQGPNKPVFVLVSSDTYSRFIIVLCHRNSGAFKNWIPEARILPASLHGGENVADLLSHWESREIHSLPKSEQSFAGVVFPRATPIIVQGKRLTVIDIILTSNRNYIFLNAMGQINWCIWYIRYQTTLFDRQTYNRVSMSHVIEDLLLLLVVFAFATVLELYYLTHGQLRTITLSMVFFIILALCYIWWCPRRMRSKDDILIALLIYFLAILWTIGKDHGDSEERQRLQKQKARHK